MNSTNNNNDNFETDFLIDALVELARSLKDKGIPLLIGGGLSLYIRTVYLHKKRSPRYPKKVLQRSTKDIDVFLTSDIIIDSDKFELIRDTIKSLRYEPKTKYFQFTKEISSGKRVILDILSAPPDPKQSDKTEYTFPRIRPKGSKKFHAFLVNEAKDLLLGNINVEELTKDEKFSNIYIPSSYNYIIFKLHAFRDRIEDEAKEYGRHHAYDIFATVTDMDINDWQNAKEHYKKQENSDYINRAKDIILQYFSEATQKGIIRLKENEYYRRNSNEFDGYINNFISDLKELFKAN